jgi:hypothetical protein
MSDIEIVYSCVQNKTYRDKTQLELVCQKVQDKKLIKGFLTQLYSNSEGYDIDKNIPVELMVSIFEEESQSGEDLFSSSEYYIEKLKEINDFTMGKNKFLILFLTEIESSIKDDGDKELKESDINYEKLEEILKHCEDLRYIEYVKSNLLKWEMYEFLKIVDKYLN